MMDSQTTGRVTLFPDGKYRWVYEVNLFKNASTFYDVVKVIGLTLGLVYGMMLIMGIFVIDDWSVVWPMTLAFFCIALGLCLLCLIIYWIWAAANGGRYAALFEMDEHGITHSQMQKHVRQQQIVSGIGVAVGLATGKPGVIGNSLLAASVNKWKSDFASVRKVKAVPHRNLIKVSELLTMNRIFVDNPEDYKFVLDYIRQLCPRVNKNLEKRNREKH